MGCTQETLGAPPKGDTLGRLQVQPLVSLPHLSVKGSGWGRAGLRLFASVCFAWPCGSLIVSCQCESHLAASCLGARRGGSCF